MLTQRKRQRTVEDFNQFCTFVLAYAGYIPYPKEEWWCTDGRPLDSSTHNTNRAWAYLSSPSTDDVPSQAKKGKGETGKRRKSDKKMTSQREKKPKGCDSGSTKESPKAKKTLLSLNQALPENKGNSDRPHEIQTNQESIPSSALSNHHNDDRTGAMGTQGLEGPCENNDSDISQTRGSASEEVREEPVDLTIGGLIENLLKAKCNPQGEDGAEKERTESRHHEEEGEERKSTQGSESVIGNTDVLRLVMDKRLKGLLPYDQETGYHTDMDGSDTEQDPHTVDYNTTISAVGRGDMSADHSKMEDDDSWDLITCFCLKPFAGRPMIECSECATWVHLSCAKIRRTHVPDVFICQPCRDSKQNIRRSNRPRIPPRKRFSD